MWIKTLSDFIFFQDKHDLWHPSLEFNLNLMSCLAFIIVFLHQNIKRGDRSSLKWLTLNLESSLRSKWDTTCWSTFPSAPHICRMGVVLKQTLFLPSDTCLFALRGDAGAPFPRGDSPPAPAAKPFHGFPCSAPLPLKCLCAETAGSLSEPPSILLVRWKWADRFPACCYRSISSPRSVCDLSFSAAGTVRVWRRELHCSGS